MGYFKLTDVNFNYNNTPILKDINLSIKKGSFLGLLGPNGSGKTTLLKLLSGALVPRKGQVLLGGRNVKEIPARERASLLGVVPQESYFDFPFSLQEVVAMGRYPYLDWWGKLGARDLQKIDEALNLTGLTDIRAKTITNLSGGEKQRAIIARALAQEPVTLLLDEPVANLDIKYQQEIFELLSYLNYSQGITIIVISHDLNLASQYCSSLAMLDRGTVKVFGLPQEVIKAEIIEAVYGVKVEITVNEKTKRPQIALLSSQKERFAQGQKKNFKVHLIGGGGSVGHILPELIRAGYSVTLGVVNEGDTDSEAARYLNIEAVVEKPFAPITVANLAANQDLIDRADGIIIADVPFGFGNLDNLKQVLAAKQRGKIVWALKGENINKRDYTNGEAETYWTELKSLGMLELSWQEILTHIIKEEESIGEKKA